ncbi:multiple organellar RNA editing factor 5, chloroplastic/mitochondrial-like [Magnolia sinica]|uniref:multiple organellar RNA editing factor 5, chloroplastic/mitochondrial-like n=1 Tax=Magnolia sinica TaxID=86752 RepID=UPI00265975F5|nr:multiple organellar RNA editing factor 5, chloroplastic/mitochondrial-like [Magnolia sinica]
MPRPTNQARSLISEEEGKKKIYNVSYERYFGFGCEIDEETSNKLEGWYQVFASYLCFQIPMLMLRTRTMEVSISAS